VPSDLGRLCHDELGYLTITRTLHSFNGLRLMHMPGYFPPGQTCASLAAAGATQWPTYFFGLMPTLTAPPQAQPAGDFISGMSMSTRYGGDGVGMVTLERESSFEASDINIAGMYAHFAARLSEQGWMNDSEDSGLKSAVSAWYKTAAPPANVDASDTELTGFLSIVHTGGDDYRVRFSVEAATGAEFSMGPVFAVPYDIMGNGERPPLNVPQIGIRGIPAGYTPR
jgi:hypothetical protein